MPLRSTKRCLHPDTPECIAATADDDYPEDDEDDDADDYPGDDEDDDYPGDDEDDDDEEDE